MIPNCEGCKVEYETALDYLEKGYNLCFENLGKGRVKESIFLLQFLIKTEK
ncbi:MAG: hypothetical protein Q8N99_07070 [Nanoarchaeota archaeon]|nr:hypothetical protein [Nanoarchaeota archaeon]